MSAQINDGGPAFPGGVNSVYTNLIEGEPTQAGMTLRDYFAANALWSPGIGKQGKEFLFARAQEAYAFADAMLAARKVQL